nr:hypothetical protein CFP56_09666 [Quercus suber]
MEKMLNFIDSQQAAMDKQQAAMERLQGALADMSDRMKRMEYASPPDPSVGQRAWQRPSAPPPIMEAAEGMAQEEDPSQVRNPALGDHRTAPHKLLMLWPSVQMLLLTANDNSSESYVMSAEDRGVLRLYTRGESSLDDIEGLQPTGPASPARSEESGEGAPTPPEGLWGIGLTGTPGSNVARRSDCQPVGGLKSDGSLDLDAHTVTTLHDSYVRHFHIMHPFLDKNRLRRMVDTFIKRYSPGPQKYRPAFAVSGQGNDFERPLKRQRSNGSAALESSAPYPSHAHHSNVPERSPSNAIIYLVLALGKMGTYTKSLPGPVSEQSLNSGAAINSQSIAESPMSGATFKTSPISPGITPMTHATPTHLDHLQSRSRRSSVDGPSTAGSRNLDVIPGLAYFAKALEVLGDQADGQDLVHAQMFLLAGLYKGQLARVKESLSWFTMAGRVLQMLLDREKLFNHNYWTDEGAITTRLERGQAIIKNMRINLIVVASWSCLQLESDILAELKLPASNLPDYEDRLLFPRKMPEDESYGGLDPSVQHEDGGNVPSEEVINLFYMGQLYIRRRLNKVHRELYGSQCHKMSLEEVRETLVTHEKYLQEWRNAVPQNTRWEDEDPAPADILSARLRAKYWGARYVINRPFLDYFLHIMPHVKEGKRVEESARDNNGHSRHAEEIHIFKAIALMKESEIMSACVRCVQAAMYSTVAFDNVPDRLIVTNIHGTAHA